MNTVLEKALDPVQDVQFNQKHPRAQAGNIGLKPGQFAPKSEAEKLADEAEAQEEQDAQVEPETSDPADSTTVRLGDNEDDAVEAVSTQHANNLRKSAEEVVPTAHPDLVVVFAGRADATKFAIAVDHLNENAAQTRVDAGPNGKYYVSAEGLTAVEIDALQGMVHARLPLHEITREALDASLNPPLEEALEPDPEPTEESQEEEPPKKKRRRRPPTPRVTAVDQGDADMGAVNAGIEETGREILQEAVASKKVHEDNLHEVLAMARAIASLSPSRETGILPVAEAIHYGSFKGLDEHANNSDLELAARARIIQDQMGPVNVMQKGTPMRNPLLVPVKMPDHDSMDADGKALPLGTHERVADRVGDEETITEKTARYPRPGHKKARRPKLILSR